MSKIKKLFWIQCIIFFIIGGSSVIWGKDSSGYPLTFENKLILLGIWILVFLIFWILECIFFKLINRK